MQLETMASLDLETVLIPTSGVLLGIVSFFITRFFTKADKVEDSQVTHVTHIALIHEKIGQHASSEQKQWSTIDALTREVSELKLKVAVLEQRGKP